MTDKPIACWMFWTYKPDFQDFMIDRVTGRLGWSHCGIGFNLSSGASHYYEAHWKDGFTGPHQAVKLQLWEIEGPGRRLEIVHLPLEPWQVLLMFRRTEKLVNGQKGYGRTQIFWMYLFERFGIRVPRTPRRPVCSEALSRIAEGLINLRGKRRHDEVSPNWARYKLGEWLS